MDTKNKKAKKFDVSIIIVSWNRVNDVSYTLDILLQQIQGLQCEIIVADNGSEDGTCQLVREKYPQVHLIEIGENTGIKAFNIGAAAASGKYCVFLDDDSHLEKQALEEMVKTMEANPDVGVIGFRIVLPESKEVVNSDWERYITSFWGCGFAVRKKIIDDIGLYDEKLFLYTNEYEFAIRVWDLGYKVVFSPTITAFHRISSMNRASGRLIYLSIRNDIWFNMKYIPFPYIMYTLPVNVMNWFLRSLLERTVRWFFKGFCEGLSNPMYTGKQKLKNETVLFYVKNHRNFENPIKKIFRKIGDKSLFKKVRNV